MTLLVDTSVWSLAFRRDAPPDVPQVAALNQALSGHEDVATTGLVLLELLKGFVPSQVEAELTERFAVLQFWEPMREDYIAAAKLSNTCRQSGVQLATVDSIIAQLAIAHDAVLLTTDQDFALASAFAPLRVWAPPTRI